jgi:hypothetical protein
MERAAVMVLALTGCYPVVSNEPKPCQDEAQQAVFKAWGVEHRSVPILWSSKEQLDCMGADPTGAPIMVEPGTGLGWVDKDGDCVRGLLQSPGDMLALAEADRLEDTELVHELAHVVFGDPDHQLQTATGSVWIQIGNAAIAAACPSGIIAQ